MHLQQMKKKQLLCVRSSVDGRLVWSASPSTDYIHAVYVIIIIILI